MSKKRRKSPLDGLPDELLYFLGRLDTLKDLVAEWFGEDFEADVATAIVLIVELKRRDLGLS